MWKIRKELAEVKRENMEMFNSICRSEERMKNVPPPGTSYKRRGSSRYDGRGVDDSSDDGHDDGVFERKRRRR